jgi:prepilin-type processing-associated H-X9-DG protein
LAQLTQFYANTYQDWIPSHYTSGEAGFATDGAALLGPTGDGNTTPNTPVTSFDWMSPMIGDSAALSPNRAQRTYQLLNDWGCASARVVNQTYFTQSSPGDADQFEALQEGGGGRSGPFRQSSFLRPTSFDRVSFNAPSNIRAIRNTYPNQVETSRNNTGVFQNPVTTPAAFVPRFDRIGNQLSQKVNFMDGTRFLEYPSKILDFDIDPDPSNFTDQPIRTESNAYGFNRSGQTGDKPHLKLSFRHNDGVQAAFFDSSVRYLKRSEVYERMDYFAPSGSRIASGGSGIAYAEALARFPNFSILP